MNLKIAKSLARTSELLIKLSPKGKSNNLFDVSDVKAVLGERRGAQGREGGNAWVDFYYYYYFWSNNYGYSLQREGLRPKMLITALPT